MNINKVKYNNMIKTKIFNLMNIKKIKKISNIIKNWYKFKINLINKIKIFNKFQIIIKFIKIMKNIMNNNNN